MKPAKNWLYHLFLLLAVVNLVLNQDFNAMQFKSM